MKKKPLKSPAATASPVAGPYYQRTGAPEFVTVPAHELAPSPTQPRAHFDEGELAGLAESIRASGVTQRVLVRRRPQPWVAFEAEPLLKLPPRIESPGVEGYIEWSSFEYAQREAVFRNGLPWELIAGERRTRACRLIALDYPVPCEVRDDLTPEQIRLGQLTENTQRADLSPLEEARSLVALRDEFSLTIAQLCARTGKAKSAIHERLALVKLPAPILAALEAGTIDPSLATLLGRVGGDDALHAKLLKEVLEAEDDGRDEDGKWHQFTRPMSYREAKDHIASEYQIELEDAPFDREDESLAGECGAVVCSRCPHRSGNIEDGGYKNLDLCLNATCFNRKREIHTARLLAGARADGLEVIDPAKAQKLFHHGGLSYNAPYLQATDKPGESDKTVLALLKKSDVKPVAAVNPESGELVKLFPRAEAEAELVKQKVLKPSQTHEGRNKPEPKETAEAKAKRELKERIAKESREAVVRAGVAAIELLELDDPRLGPVLRVLAENGTHWGNWTAREALERRGVKGKPEKWFGGLAVPAKIAWLWEAAVQPDYRDDEVPGAAALGVDAEVILEETRTRILGELEQKAGELGPQKAQKKGKKGKGAK